MIKRISLILLFLVVLNFLFGKDIICNYCHKPITGEYIEINGKYYHPDHFKCDYCHKTIKGNQFIKKDGKYYHEKCFFNHIVPKCAVCGKPIKGEYLKNYWGQIYHPRHQNHLTKCEYCGRIIKHPHTDENGFYVCDLCKRKEITELYEAKDIIDKINRILYKKDIEIDLSNIDIHLITLSEMKKISKNPNITSDNKGMAEYKIIKTGETEKKNYNIYLLKNMPKYTFVEVAAHELMHIWIYENGEKEQEPALVEGSCNYASYLVLTELKKKDQFRLLQLNDKYIDYSITTLQNNNDPIYGDGYRRIKKYAAKYGIFMWLNYLKHHKNLPY